jgi:hypothetical protein
MHQYALGSRCIRGACCLNVRKLVGKVVGLEGFEPPTHGLGNLVPVLSGPENCGLYYTRQPVTSQNI